MDVDIAQLIREVERRPDLWDQRSLYHNNRAVVHQLWAEVAYTCGIPVDVTRTKWKSLRDNYRQEIRKLQRGKYGDPTVSPSQHKSTWVWYKRLMFLKSQVPPYCERHPSAICDTEPSSFESVPPTDRRKTRETPPRSEKMENFYYDINSVCDTVLEEPAENWEASVHPSLHNNFQRFFRPLQSSLIISPVPSPTGGPSKTPILKFKKTKKSKDETHMYLLSLLTPLRCLPKDRQHYVLDRIKQLILEQTEKLTVKPEPKDMEQKIVRPRDSSE